MSSISLLAKRTNMTLNDLTVNFSNLDVENILTDWHWLIGDNKLPVLLTACGNAFIQDTKNKTVHFLDTVDGSIEEVTESPKEFELYLSDKEFIISYFEVELIGDLMKSGVNLQENKIYSYIKPPILGGKCEIENIEVTDISVHFSIAGQIHCQVKDLPEGTQINDVVIK